MKVSAPKAKKPAPAAKKEPIKAAREPSVSDGPTKVVRGGGGSRPAGDAAKGKKGNMLGLLLNIWRCFISRTKNWDLNKYQL